MQRMKVESFSECLQRTLDEEHMSASEAARLVGFRSRNSMFRILAGDTSHEVDAKFLAAFREAIGDAWPKERFDALEEALNIKRVGMNEYRSYQAIGAMINDQETSEPVLVRSINADGTDEEHALLELLQPMAQCAKVEIVMSSCCQSAISWTLAEAFNRAGEEGRVSMRHYVYIGDDEVAQNITGILPLVSKIWYNARLIDHDSCPPEMVALYLTGCWFIIVEDEQGGKQQHQFVLYDKGRFAYGKKGGLLVPVIHILDTWRYKLELLKPVLRLEGRAEDFVAYTAQYAALEEECAIYSIKPDVHFNCLPTQLLLGAVTEGFEQAGLAEGAELNELMAALVKIHDARNANMFTKHRPTHLVYSMPALERFMQTGVQTDHFFIQRAYTVEERKAIIRHLLQVAAENPFFHIHLLRADFPEVQNEITLYEGKGVLMLDAYTGYELSENHSEALITLPAFMQKFRSYFVNELLRKHVLSPAETRAALEQMMNAV